MNMLINMRFVSVLILRPLDGVGMLYKRSIAQERATALRNIQSYTEPVYKDERRTSIT